MHASLCCSCRSSFQYKAGEIFHVSPDFSVSVCEFSFPVTVPGPPRAARGLHAAPIPAPSVTAPVHPWAWRSKEIRIIISARDSDSSHSARCKLQNILRECLLTSRPRVGSCDALWAPPISGHSLRICSPFNLDGAERPLIDAHNLCRPLLSPSGSPALGAGGAGLRSPAPFIGICSASLLE